MQSYPSVTQPCLLTSDLDTSIFPAYETPSFVVMDLMLQLQWFSKCLPKEALSRSGQNGRLGAADPRYQAAGGVEGGSGMCGDNTPLCGTLVFPGLVVWGYMQHLLLEVEHSSNWAYLPFLGFKRL